MKKRTRKIKVTWDNGAEMIFENVTDVAAHFGSTPPYIYKVIGRNDGRMKSRFCKIRFMPKDKLQTEKGKRENLDCMPNQLKAALAMMDKRTSEVKMWNKSVR